MCKRPTKTLLVENLKRKKKKNRKNYRTINKNKCHAVSLSFRDKKKAMERNRKTKNDSNQNVRLSKEIRWINFEKSVSLFWNYLNLGKEKIFDRKWAMSNILHWKCVCIICCYVYINKLAAHTEYTDAIEFDIWFWSIWSTSVVLSNSLNLILSLIHHHSRMKRKKYVQFDVFVLSIIP